MALGLSPRDPHCAQFMSTLNIPVVRYVVVVKVKQTNKQTNKQVLNLDRPVTGLGLRYHVGIHYG